MASEVTLPPFGSRWVDMDGLDGEVTVTGHDKGCYVLAVNAVDEELYIQWEWFGRRYRPLPPEVD